MNMIIIAVSNKAFPPPQKFLSNMNFYYGMAF